MRLSVVVWLALLAAVGCTSEKADPVGTTLPAHAVTPTPEMEQLARQQCFDDPELVTGVVQVVEPDTETVVARIELDCDEARAAQIDN